MATGTPKTLMARCVEQRVLWNKTGLSLKAGRLTRLISRLCPVGWPEGTLVSSHQGVEGILLLTRLAKTGCLTYPPLVPWLTYLLIFLPTLRPQSCTEGQLLVRRPPILALPEDWELVKPLPSQSRAIPIKTFLGVCKLIKTTKFAKNLSEKRQWAFC